MVVSSQSVSQSVSENTLTSHVHVVRYLAVRAANLSRVRESATPRLPGGCRSLINRLSLTRLLPMVRILFDPLPTTHCSSPVTPERCCISCVPLKKVSDLKADDPASPTSTPTRQEPHPSTLLTQFSAIAPHASHQPLTASYILQSEQYGRTEIPHWRSHQRNSHSS